MGSKSGKLLASEWKEMQARGENPEIEVNDQDGKEYLINPFQTKKLKDQIRRNKIPNQKIKNLDFDRINEEHEDFITFDNRKILNKSGLNMGIRAQNLEEGSEEGYGTLEGAAGGPQRSPR